MADVFLTIVISQLKEYDKLGYERIRLNKSFKFSDIENCLIFGAGHGIGLAIVTHLLETYNHITIHASYRLKKKSSALIQLQEKFEKRIELHQLDPLNEEELSAFSKKVAEFDLLINSIGVLHDSNGLAPEKSLAEVNLGNLTHAFQVNAALTPLLAKYIKPRKNQGHLNAFVSISAKVGSISDNRMGGWYAYRASKAALNMFLKNIALEYERKNQECLVLSIHPGTTVTELSNPYIEKTSLKLHSPEETAKNILSVIEGKTLEENGKFYSWDGEELPW